jgi:hypothetical protein
MGLAGIIKEKECHKGQAANVNNNVHPVIFFAVAANGVNIVKCKHRCGNPKKVIDEIATGKGLHQ